MQNEAWPLPIPRLCRLFISESVEGLLQTFDETRLLLTPSHVALPLLSA
jgi:hypothetical protein